MIFPLVVLELLHNHRKPMLLTNPGRTGAGMGDALGTTAVSNLWTTHMGAYQGLENGYWGKPEKNGAEGLALIVSVR